MDIDSSDPSGGGPGPGGGGAGGNGNGSDDIIAGQLLHQFSCMNTTDKDVLIIELKKLVGDAINNETAQFWLDMNNWSVLVIIYCISNLKILLIMSHEEGFARRFRVTSVLMYKKASSTSSKNFLV